MMDFSVGQHCALLLFIPILFIAFQDEMSVIGPVFCYIFPQSATYRIFFLLYYACCGPGATYCQKNTIQQKLTRIVFGVQNYCEDEFCLFNKTQVIPALPSGVY